MVDKGHLQSRGELTDKVKQQYKTPANLSARSDLHSRFSTSKDNWNQWLFDHLDLSKNESVLDIGCGPSWLWQGNVDRVPPGVKLILTDLSQGMVAEARGNLSGAGFSPIILVADAGDIPLDSGSFNLVAANHYALPQISV